jgi:hypothetical protein
MKDNYERFGDKLGVDSTYKLVKDHPQNKSYKLAVLMGESTSKKIVPFGMTLFLDETKERYLHLLQSFK